MLHSEQLVAPLELQHIRKCEKDNTGSGSSVNNALQTHVRVAVHDHAGSVTYYACPLFLLQSSSPVLSEQLEDQMLMHGGFGGSSTTSTSTPAVRVPYSCSPEVFETIALYMEHFFGVENVMELEVPTAAELSRSHRPTLLQPPLQLNDLYGLQVWELAFVWQRLLDIPGTLMARKDTAKSNAIGVELQELVLQGRWVDAVAASQLNGPPVTAVRAEGTSSEDVGVLSFSLDERQAMLGRLLAVVEVSTRLQMPTLQSLCAALVANMVMDLPDEELRRVLARPSSAALPSLTSERRETLYHRYPWVDVRDPKSKKVALPTNPPPTSSEESRALGSPAASARGVSETTTPSRE